MAFNHGNVTFGGGGAGGGGSGGNTTTVTVATTANINLATPPSSIDGVTLANGNIVLVNNQTASPQNGIYLFNSTSSAMTRASGFTIWSAFIGLIVNVTLGTANHDTSWLSKASSGGTIDVTNLLFSDITGQAYTASGGITLSGSNFTLTTTTAPSNQFAKGVNSNGNIIYSQPSFSDLSSNIVTSQLPNGGVNGASELVQLNSSTQLPAIDGSLLTNLTGGLNSTTNSLTVAINGSTASSAVSLINSNSTSYTGNNLVTTVNGIASTALEIDGGSILVTDPTGSGTNNVLLNTVLSNLNTSDSYTAGTGLTLTGNEFSITSPIPISLGGTNSPTANGALNNLLPTQTGHANQVLQTDGAGNTYWSSVSADIVVPAKTINVATNGTIGASVTTSIDDAISQLPIGGFIKINSGSFVSPSITNSLNNFTFEGLSPQQSIITVDTSAYIKINSNDNIYFSDLTISGIGTNSNLFDASGATQVKIKFDNCILLTVGSIGNTFYANGTSLLPCSGQYAFNNCTLNGNTIFNGTFNLNNGDLTRILFNNCSDLGNTPANLQLTFDPSSTAKVSTIIKNNSNMNTQKGLSSQTGGIFNASNCYIGGNFHSIPSETNNISTFINVSNFNPGYTNSSDMYTPLSLYDDNAIGNSIINCDFTNEITTLNDGRQFGINAAVIGPNTSTRVLTVNNNIYPSDSLVYITCSTNNLTMNLYDITQFNNIGTTLTIVRTDTKNYIATLNCPSNCVIMNGTQPGELNSYILRSGSSVTFTIGIINGKGNYNV